MAAATGIVPLYDVPVMPTLPVDQDVAVDFFRAVDRLVALRAAIQPVDDGLRRELLGCAADRGTSLRQPGARRVGVHDRKSARHPRRSTSEFDTLAPGWLIRE